MKIYLNEKEIEVNDGIKIDELKKQNKPNADIKIYNGFPINKNIELKENDRVVFINKGEKPNKDDLEALMVSRHTPEVHEKLKQATVGIAGAGGLGSNVAFSLARMGINKLIVVDYDIVEPSNLNRQQYFVDQIGMYKVEAIKENIKKINPFVKTKAVVDVIKENNIKKYFNSCDVIVEAFDKPEAKAMLVNFVLNKMDCPIVAGSGMAGYGPNNEIKTKKIGENFYMCGDGKSEAKPGNGLMAPRVGICANHQANQVVRILLND